MMETKWVIVIIVAALALLFIRVPVDSFPDDTPYLYCEDGVVKIDSGEDEVDYIWIKSTVDIAQMTNAGRCSISADGDFEATSQTKCVNDEPTVVCKTQLWRALLLGKIEFVPGDSSTNEKEESDESRYEEMCKEALESLKESGDAEAQGREYEGYSITVTDDEKWLFCKASGDYGHWLKLD